MLLQIVQLCLSAMAAHFIRAIHRGAVDIIAIVQEDGSIVANPFHIKLCHRCDFMAKVLHDTTVYGILFLDTRTTIGQCTGQWD